MRSERHVRTRKEKQFGGSEVTTTTYSYAPVWSEQAIDSAGFKKPEGHLNPAPPFSSAEYAANDVTLGAFRLTSGIVGQLTAADPVDVSGAKLPDSIRAKARPAARSSLWPWESRAPAACSQPPKLQIRYAPGFFGPPV